MFVKLPSQLYAAALSNSSVSSPRVSQMYSRESLHRAVKFMLAGELLVAHLLASQNKTVMKQSRLYVTTVSQ